MVEELLKENERLKGIVRELSEQNKTLVREKLALQQRLQNLLRRIYGRRSEKIDPDQLLLFALEEMEKKPPEEACPKEPEAVPDDEEPPRRARRRSRGRKPLPESLPRVEVVHDLPSEDRICPGCKEPMRKIGEDVSEELEYVPAYLVVVRHLMPKYACRRCEDGVVRAAAPPKPIEKGRPGPGLLAHVLVSKYNDHLPLHRQEAIFARHGVEIPRSTLCDWVRQGAKLLGPVVEEIRKKLLESPVIQSDDTPIRVQDPENPGKTRRSILWAYRGVDGEVVFKFTKTRSGEGPARFLAGYRGTIQVDGYSGYRDVFQAGQARHAGCWAHARRKFYDARDDDPVIAATVLAAIQKLYAIEREAKERGLSAERRQDLRQREAAPILSDLKAVLLKGKQTPLPRSPLGEAIAYTLSQWLPLNEYLKNGELEIDNNAIERAIRGVALGRKNWIFAGSDAGGERAAVIYSLIETCKHLKIDCFAYLRDTIDRLTTGEYESISELTPHGWNERLESSGAPFQPCT